MKTDLIQQNRTLWNSAGRRMLCLKWALCAAFLAAMAVSPKIWITDRPFPTVPVFAGIPDLPQSLSIALSLLLILSLLALTVIPKPGTLTLIPAALTGALVFFDINRLQPCVYQYTFMLLALAIYQWDNPDAKRSKAAWACCAVILLGIYFWSGIQKFNSGFARDQFPWLLQPFGTQVSSALKPFWLVAPMGESGMGLLLLIPKTRKLGLISIGVMHCFLLFALGPLGRNYDSIVWPWNVAVMVFALILFTKNDDQVIRFAWPHPLGKFVLALFGFTPILNFFGKWDAFLSASFYSSKLRGGWIYLTENGKNHLPPEYIKNNEGFEEDAPGRYKLDIMRWSMSRLNAPPYAEPRCYIQIAMKLQEAGVPPQEMILMVRDRPTLTEKEETYSQVPIP